ncbi:hypothetical protein PT2222_480001 [Paraburkholderia tropica]
MRTLRSGELNYIESDNGNLSIQPVSYNYAKSLLFGFTGWDKYILTEDDVLAEFIEFVIRRYLLSTFFKYKIIFVGGGSNTIQLMIRNSEQHFFSTEENVISILDGDQRNQRFVRDRADIGFLPWESIEKQVFIEYFQELQWTRLDLLENPGIENPDGKSLFKALIRRRVVTLEQIFVHLCDRYEQPVRDFADALSRFLNR